MNERQQENDEFIEHDRMSYMDRVIPFVGKPMVKVITGMRRCGKSCFMRQIVRHLRQTMRVPENRIVYIDKESLAFESVATHRDLHHAVERVRAGGSGMTYVFVDEVQEIEDWEKAIASLSGQRSVDVYISGSNAHLFSSELATKLSGRFVEIPLYTLDFAEFLKFRGNGRGTVQEEFERYLRYGGFPAIHQLALRDETVYPYIQAIYNTILLKDVVRRYQVRHVPLLESVGRFLMDNIGQVFSANSICRYLKSQRLKVGVETVQAYAGHFVEAGLAHKVSRLDIRGKRHLEIGEKYYLGDIGLRHAVLGFREADMGGWLENIVFLHLKRNGYTVSVGRQGVAEVDFVAERSNERIYVQVAYLLVDPRTLQREVAPLKAIADNYPKYLLSMDRVFGSDIDGIHRINLVDFLSA